MDLKDFEGTSILAIEAVYKHFWHFIPSKYRIAETDEMISDMSPFYDPELTFENRFHYNLSKVAYPKRAKPWFVITWNTENGLLDSSISQRRFTSAVVNTEKYGKVKFKFINTELQINFAIYCNTMQGLFELQENILLQQREKSYVMTKPHSIIGSFPVSLNIIDSTQNKMEKEKGTLCYLFMQCKIDYPVIGNVVSAQRGVIEQINNKIMNDKEEVLVDDTITSE